VIERKAKGTVVVHKKFPNAPHGSRLLDGRNGLAPVANPSYDPIEKKVGGCVSLYK
jgi:hypothetical protein